MFLKLTVDGKFLDGGYGIPLISILKNRLNFHIFGEKGFLMGKKGHPRHRLGLDWNDWYSKLGIRGFTASGTLILFLLKHNRVSL